MFTLVIENRDGEIVDEHSFEEGEFITGRSQHCDVILASPNVSRRHARLLVQDGKAFIEDLNSANGVYVAGVRIHGIAELGQSAQVRIGDYVLHVEGSPSAVGVSEPAFGKLIMITPEGPGRVFWVNKPTMLLGRGRDAAITILDPSISRIHAKMTVDSGGRVLLEDLQSANGSYCNGERVEKAELRDGDMVRLGNQDLRFERAGAPVSSAPPTRMPSFQDVPLDVPRSRTPIIVLVAVGVLVVGVGVGVGLALFLVDRGGSGTAVPGGGTHAAAANPNAPDGSPGGDIPQVADERARLRKCLREANKAYSKNNLDDMATAVACAEALDALDKRVVRLRNKLELERGWTAQIGSAKKALKKGRPGTARRALLQIGPDSRSYKEVATLRTQALESLNALKVTFDSECSRHRRRPPAPCRVMIDELLINWPTDTKLLKLKRRWGK